MKVGVWKAGLTGVVAAASLLLWQYWPRSAPDWTTAEVLVLESLSLQSLPRLPADASNGVADNPDAAALGKRLFHDARLSANGGISCATCHQPIRNFSDGLQKAQAIGTAKRNTPSIVGTAYSPWLYWDGRRDSQWSQALSPLEDANEHAFDRVQVLRLIADDGEYLAQYEFLFGKLADTRNMRREDIDRAFANIGKSIAAFERTLLPLPTRFDEYVKAVVAGDLLLQERLFDDDEKWGLRHFVGAANCMQCHNGPLMTNNEFHNTGVISFPGEVPDPGRIEGIELAMKNDFNCLREFSDDADRKCDELEFARTGRELLGAMRTPSLRNLRDTAPYMHKGQLASLADVLRHYNEAPDAMIGHNEAKPLGLDSNELHQLEMFLLTLATPVNLDAS
jgi:cytochrome c peroxidase